MFYTITQVNTLAAERLYTLAGDWANLNSDTLLFDVCCGTGTIGLTLAHRVGMVIYFTQFVIYFNTQLQLEPLLTYLDSC